MSSSTSSSLSCWKPSRRKVNVKKTVSSPFRPISASYLDGLPPEIFQRVSHYLEDVDAFVLSLCSREWLCRAWNFKTSLELHPFLVAAPSKAYFGPSSPVKESPPISSTLSPVKGATIDLLKLPNGPISPTHNQSRITKSHPPELEPELGHCLPASTRHPKIAQSKKKSASSEEILEFRTSSSSASPSQPYPKSRPALSRSNQLLPQDPLPASPPTSSRRTSDWNLADFLQVLLPRFAPGQLLELSLAGCPINPRIFKRIVATECRSTLLALNLENCLGMSSSCMRYIAKLSSLQYLNLRGCDGMGSTSLKYLRNMISLTFLDLKDTQCIKRTPPLMPAKRYSTNQESTYSYGGIRSHPASYFADKRSYRASFLSSDSDSSEEEEEELEAVTAFRRRADIPLEWYTPSHLIVDAVSYLSNLVVLNISEWNKNLTRVENIDLLAKLTSLRSLQLQHGGCVEVLAKLPHLESLSFATTTYANYYVLGTQFANVSLPHLKHINFTNCYRINDAALTLVVEAAPNLVELKLCFCDGISDFSLINTIPKLESSLRLLDLRHVDTLTEDGLLHLSKLGKLKSLCLRHVDGLQSCTPFANMPNLRELDLSYCSNVQNESIAELANIKLKHLSLRGLKLLDLNAIRPLLTKPCFLSTLDLQECPALAYALNTAKSVWKEMRRLLPSCLQECLVSAK